MKKITETWSIAELENLHVMIDFPEYQREPNLWSRDAKQRLIDSIMREFDVASLYLYLHEDGSIDCVDGRQRIGAIMSFLEKNQEDVNDNGFTFRVLNEAFSDSDHPWTGLDNSTFQQIMERAKGGNELAQRFLQSFTDYRLTVTQLSESGAPEEFNLQFTRLNLGVIINSGERLNAMVGEIRNVCFDQIGQHDFLRDVNIPTRRYAREQLASQIASQVFSVEKSRQEGAEIEYARTRHFDLQGFFKRNFSLSDVQKEWVARTVRIMDLLGAAFEDFEGLRSRAMVLSAVLLAYERGINTLEEAREIANFVRQFVERLRWQVKKGLDADEEYRYLMDFQRYLTQASVERSAVTERAKVLHQELRFWQENRELRGDSEYRDRNGGAEPDE